jgi:hypothetical protein
MSCGLEFFSTEVSAAPPKVIAHVPPNELYVVIHSLTANKEPWSPVSIVSGYGLDDRAIRGSIPGRGKRIFPVTSVSRPALRPNQPPVQWVPEIISPELKHGRSVALTTYPHVVSRSRMSRAIPPPPWRLHDGRWTALLFTVYCPAQRSCNGTIKYLSGCDMASG